MDVSTPEGLAAYREMKARAGRMGGKATAERYGREHMAEIGRKGFAGLARKLGYAGGGRRGALRMIMKKGGIPELPDLSDRELIDLQRSVGLE